MSDELNYYKSKIDELTGQVIKADSVVSRSKRELGQRRKALSLLSDLQRQIRVDMPEEQVAKLALSATATALKMDRTILFRRDESGKLNAVLTLGYPPTDDPLGSGVDLPQTGDLLVTAATAPTPAIEQLRSVAKIPYFAAVPLKIGDRVTGIILSGRLKEQKPFFPALDEGDLATWQATAGFLGSALFNAELFARTKRQADSFARFVPTEFLELLGNKDMTDVGLGDQRQLELTILFSDIRGFTTLSEGMTPEETFEFVNGYLAHAAPVIRRHRGFIDKYIGDAIMALFPHSPLDGLKAGIELAHSVEGFNASSLMVGRKPVAIGVGVHTGKVMLGTVGFSIETDARLNCTVIADAVNLASRLEGLTKVYGSALIASGDVLARIPKAEQPEHRLVDRVMVKGKSEAVELYDVFAADTLAAQQKRKVNQAAFEHALNAYTAGDLTAARTELERVTANDPEDLATSTLLKRISQLERDGLPTGWAGVSKLDSK